MFFCFFALTVTFYLESDSSPLYLSNSVGLINLETVVGTEENGTNILRTAISGGKEKRWGTGGEQRVGGIMSTSSYGMSINSPFFLWLRS